MLIGGSLTLLGHVIVQTYMRRTSREAKEIEAHTARETKQIEAQTKFTTDLLARIQHLEGRLDEISRQNTDLIRENSDLKSELKRLEEDRLELKQALDRSSDTIRNLEATLRSLGHVPTLPT